MSLKVIRRRAVTKAANGIILVAFLWASLPLQPTQAFAALAAPDVAIPDKPYYCTGSGCYNNGPRTYTPPPCKAGTLPGAAGVSCTGAGTYEIPIEVPPGSADMQPALSLTYNSQAGNGLLGMGWSINGLSSITRCAANKEMDTYKGGINYDEDDKFCLDGQRLIPITPHTLTLPPGAVEYRTEPDTFARVISYGPIPYNPEYFTVEAKSGLITEYGNTDDSQIEAVVNFSGVPTPTDDIRVWAANKLTNRVGNYIEFKYNEDSTTGEYSPAQINYTGNPNTVPDTLPYNFIKFEYEPRSISDSAIFYQGGSFVRMTKRLKSIRTCLTELCDDANLVTHYKLEYQTGFATNRTQLKSLEQCDADISSPIVNCLPKTTMQWSDDGVTAARLAGTTDTGAYGGNKWVDSTVPLGNGDGNFMDSTTPVYQDAFMSGVNGIVNAPDVGSAVISSISLGLTIASFVTSPLTGAISYVVGAILVYIWGWFDDAYNFQIGKLADVNGDGRTDVVGFAEEPFFGNNPPPEHVWLSKPNGATNYFEKQTGWETLHVRVNEDSSVTEANEVKFGDFNGDGLMDPFFFEDLQTGGGSQGTIDGVAYFSDAENGVFIGAGNPTSPRAVDIGVIGESTLGDFNGDGKTDAARIKQSGYVYLNEYDSVLNAGQLVKQDGGPGKFLWSSCTGLGLSCGANDTPIENTLLGDVNGDGKTDIVVLNDDGITTIAKIWFTNSDGSGWSANSPITFDFLKKIRRTSSYPGVIQPGDFNGDGKMDVAVIESNGATVHPDTDNDGDSDTDDIRMQEGFFEIYFSTGLTFIKENSFNRFFSSGTNSNNNNAPFAEGPSLTFDDQYIEGSDVTFLMRFGDFNGDGKTDIIILDANDNHYGHLYLSDGVRLRDEIIWGGGFGLIDENAIGDFDGDGRVDVLQFGATGQNNPNKGEIFVTLNNNYPFPDLMVTVTDGFGKKDEFEYKPITDSVVYPDPTRATGLDNETFNFRGPLYVVSKLKTSDGIGGMYEQSYTYYGSKSHRSYGFLGFSKIINSRLFTANPPQTKIIETSEYEQTYPLNCRIKSKTVAPYNPSAAQTINSSNLFSEHTNTWSFINGTQQGGTPHIIKLDAETDIQYEIGGATLSNTRTTYGYDAYNNVTSQQTSWPDVPVVVENVTSTFYNNPTTWILGLPQSSTTTRYEPVSVPARTVQNTFDTSTGLLTTSTQLLENGRYLNTSYLDRDAFGNPRLISVDGTSILPRETDITYEPKGRFPSSVQNPLNETTTVTFEPEFGNLANVTDPNNLATNIYYDGYGRETYQERPDGTTTQTIRCPTPYPYSTYGQVVSGGVHWVQTKTTGQPETMDFFDMRGREIRSAVVGFSGIPIFTDSLYDETLRLEKVSLPRYKGATMSFTQLTYDPRGRVSGQYAPNGAVTTYTYTGSALLGPNPFPGLTSRLLWHQVTETNDLGQKTDYLINRLGQVNQVAHRDPAGTLISHMTYNYDAFDNHLGTADDNNNVTTRTFVDDRMTALSDPGTGNSTYTYDVLGNLLTTTDAKLNTFTLNYDLLDRLTSRIEPEGTSTWTYGTTVPNIGRLTQTSGGVTGFAESYQYDSLSRLFRTSTTIPGDPASFITEQTYDSAGRLYTLKYPGANNYTVRNTYNTAGYLQDVRNHTTGALIWQANALNALGQMTEQTHGNTNPGNSTLTSTFTYDKLGNLKDSIVGSKINGTITFSPLKRLAFTYDKINNLLERRNLIRPNVTVNQDYVDTFEYDGLNRLTEKFSFLDDHILQQSTPRDTINYSYNAIGNITNKTDLGTPAPNYTYPTSGQDPHAVSSVMGNAYTYDANGNMTNGRDFQNNLTRTINWFSYNKPSQISEPGKTLWFNYDTYRNKIKQTLSTTSSVFTEYINGLTEKVIYSATGNIDHKYYIYGAGANPVAMVTTSTVPASSNTRYLHYDNLGSLDLVTNEAAAIVENLSFDPHGLRRNVDWTTTTPPSSLFAHGFTNHEQIDALGIIDMKGRIYDPKIGRFLSADPFITEPFLTENLNRYSYVYNSPTNFIDPTGFQVNPGSIGPYFTPFVKDTISNSVVGSVALSVTGQALSGAGQSPNYSTPMRFDNISGPNNGNTGVAPKPTPSRPLTPQEVEQKKLEDFYKAVSKKKEETVTDQTTADLERMSQSEEAIVAITGKTALKLRKATQRNATGAEKSKIWLEGATEVFWATLQEMEGAGKAPGPKSYWRSNFANPYRAPLSEPSLFIPYKF